MQSSKELAETNFETAGCLSFLRVEILNSISLKPLGVTEN